MEQRQLRGQFAGRVGQPYTAMQGNPAGFPRCPMGNSVDHSRMRGKPMESLCRSRPRPNRRPDCLLALGLLRGPDGWTGKPDVSATARADLADELDENVHVTTEDAPRRSSCTHCLLREGARLGGGRETVRPPSGKGQVLPLWRAETDCAKHRHVTNPPG